MIKVNEYKQSKLKILSNNFRAKIGNFFKVLCKKVHCQNSSLKIEIAEDEEIAEDLTGANGHARLIPDSPEEEDKKKKKKKKKKKDGGADEEEEEEEEEEE